MFSRNVVLGVAAAAAVSGAAWTTLVAFDPQPDPPAFGVVSITPDQTIRLHALCAKHGVRGELPAACRAALMFHDAEGNVLVSQAVELKPGQTAFLDYTIGGRSTSFERAGIIPCIMPDQSRGRVLPTAEVFDNVTGQSSFHVNPLAPRLSLVLGLDRR